MDLNTFKLTRSFCDILVYFTSLNNQIIFDCWAKKTKLILFSSFLKYSGLVNTSFNFAGQVRLTPQSPRL